MEKVEEEEEEEKEEDEEEEEEKTDEEEKEGRGRKRVAVPPVSQPVSAQRLMGSQAWRSFRFSSPV